MTPISNQGKHLLDFFDGHCKCSTIHWADIAQFATYNTNCLAAQSPCCSDVSFIAIRMHTITQTYTEKLPPSCMLSMLAACPCAQCAVLTRITTHIHLTRPKKCHPLASCPMPAACPHAQYRCTYLHTNTPPAPYKCHPLASCSVPDACLHLQWRWWLPSRPLCSWPTAGQQADSPTQLKPEHCTENYLLW
jgi:hypothetical protein